MASKTKPVNAKAPAHKSKPALAPELPKKATSAEIIKQIEELLKAEGSAGYLLVVADSAGAIGTWAAATNYGDLALLGHFASKEVNRLLDNSAKPAEK